MPEMGAPEPVRVRIYCDGPAPFHEKKGVTYLETFELRDDGWHPVKVAGAKAVEATRGRRRLPHPRETGVQYLEGDDVKPFVAAMRVAARDMRVKVELACPRCHAGPVRMRWGLFTRLLDATVAAGETAVRLEAVQHIASRNAGGGTTCV